MALSKSIRFRLAVFSAVSCLLVGAVALSLSEAFLKKNLMASLRSFAHHEAQEVALVIRDMADSEAVRARGERFAELFPEKNVDALEVWSPQGELVLQIPQTYRASFPTVVDGEPVSIFETSFQGRRAFRCLYEVRSGGALRWYASSYVDLAEADEAVSRHRLDFMKITAGAAAVVFLGALCLLWIAFGDMRRVVKEARVMVADRSARRLSLPPYGSELQPLIALINEVIEGRAQANDRLKRFSANAGHELRSPLTRMRSEAELALRDSPEAKTVALESILLEVEEMRRLIEALFELANTESLAGPDVLDFAALVAEISEEGAVIAGAASQELVLESAVESAQVRGSKTLLARAVWNLIENAVKFSPPGSAVSLKLRRDSRYVEFSIKDQGGGLPGSVELLTEAFVRGENASGVPGTGLGLALTAAIIERHGGRFEGWNDQGGATFVIWLPVVPRAAERLEGLEPQPPIRGEAIAAPALTRPS